MDDIIYLSILIFAAGLLYSSVGHAGASGYLAAMALFGLAPEVMKPTALTLNILVATIATFQFYRAGFFSWDKFWPFAVSSVPFAFIGGAMSIPGNIYKQIVGLAGHLTSVNSLPSEIYFWAFAAMLGGIIGSGLGSRRLTNTTLYSLLAVVLVIAGVKFILI